MLSYPADEVGNHLVDIDLLDEKGINPWTDVLTEKDFRNYFGYQKHPFTGIDYIEYYKSLVEEYKVECEIIFSNNPKTILDYTKSVLVCDVHTRQRTKRILKANGAEKVFGLDDILTKPIDGSGYNEHYGLLGSNKATEETIKLFPNRCQEIVEQIQAIIKEKTGKTVEVLIYGDGAFKDPVGKIWELADPVVSPGYTKGLEGTPNEVKLKYLADNNFAGLKGEELEKAISDYIKNKKENLVASMESQGTTPRRLTDLIGSLCDLTSGSGDKGTPVIYIQGYFDNYAK
ncbi:MAG TPA: coenzyme F420-0:L-glutamate ligase, partial [Defluviitaleaceae bacterium]|nr:coenzyme F420-0:L-glutamate ligase [Defluviitaleaceae bacterium]